MSTTEEEVGITSPFGGSVASAERELAIDEGVPESNAVPNLQFVPNLDVVVREGEECVKRALEDVEQVIVGTRKPVKEMALWTSWAIWKKRLEVNQKDSHLRTFCNVQIYCQKMCWRVWSILLILFCVSPQSSYPVSFCL